MTYVIPRAQWFGTSFSISQGYRWVSLTQEVECRKALLMSHVRLPGLSMAMMYPLPPISEFRHGHLGLRWLDGLQVGLATQRWTPTRTGSYHSSPR